MADVCEDCGNDGITCWDWCEREGHPIPGNRAGDTCHCGAYGWVRGEVERPDVTAPEVTP